jgi:HAMP domain-containing protein
MKMKRRLTVLLFAALLACAPARSAAASAQRRGAPPRRAARARAAGSPKIREAIAALEAARAELEQSSGDYGGHKADAIEAVNNALKRLRLALQFEKY